MELPIILAADIILRLWLVNVPDHTIAFLRISLLIMLIGALENPIGTANSATGKIKKFQIVVGCFNVFIIILSYVALRLGYQPESVFIVQLVITAIVQFVKVQLVKKEIHFSIRDYTFHLVLPLIIASIISIVLPCAVYFLMDQGVIRLIVVGIISVVSVTMSAYLFGLSRTERKAVLNQVVTIWNKWTRNSENRTNVDN